MTTQRHEDNRFLEVATSLGLLPQPGFSSIAIPLPAPSLYLNTFTTAPADPFGQPDDGEDHDPSPVLLAPTRASTSSALARKQNAPPEAKGAYTLLYADGNRVNQKLISRVCEKYGQPYEVASNGREVVDMYKSDPERFRCIMMETSMPILNGFDAAREIRAFEEESMHIYKHGPPISDEASSGPDSILATQNNVGKKHSSCKRPTRRAVLVGASLYGIPGNSPLSSRYPDAGFDFVMSRPYHVRMIVDLLFGGPATNIVSLYGGINEKELLEAGYPLQLRHCSPPFEVERRVRDVVARAVR